MDDPDCYIYKEVYKYCLLSLREYLPRNIKRASTPKAITFKWCQKRFATRDKDRYETTVQGSSDIHAYQEEVIIVNTMIKLLYLIKHCRSVSLCND